MVPLMDPYGPYGPQGGLGAPGSPGQIERRKALDDQRTLKQLGVSPSSFTFAWSSWPSFCPCLGILGTPSSHLKMSSAESLPMIPFKSA